MAIARETERTKDWPDSKKKPESSVKQGLASGLGQQHAEAMEGLVSKAPKEIQDLWNKYGDDISVGDKTAKNACFKPATGKIYVNIDKDSSPNKADGTPPYETTMHESGHSIDASIGKKLGMKKFSVEYNDGEFEKSLIKEANDYIKGYQKKLSQERGTKVSISQARQELGKLMRKEGFATTGDVSDMLGGATKGKFVGSGGHSKTYWTGSTQFGGLIKIPGHSVASEAFAEMFSAMTTNPASLAKIKEVFPKSHDVFMKMIREASK